MLDKHKQLFYNNYTKLEWSDVYEKYEERKSNF